MVSSPNVPPNPGVPAWASSRPPQQFRDDVRHGRWTGPTSGCCTGYTQLNLVVLPERYASDFERFCRLNPKPCPVLEIVTAGGVEPSLLAPGADLRTDIPSYRVFRGAQISEQATVHDLWRDDFVSFLIGCSFTFESALLAAGIPVRHVEQGCNVPMYRTTLDCQVAGPFRSQLVVSMRPIPRDLIDQVYAITGRYPAVHGAPIHHGDPKKIGIADLARPDYGDPVVIGAGEVPVFWACGVTPQAALVNACPEIAITHAPGHMLVSDRRDEEFLDAPSPGPGS